MKGVIKNYRRGRHNANERQLVLEIDGVTSKEKAYALVGSRVEWKSPSGKVFSGTITSAHGNSGAVRAIFQKGLPGQCIGQEALVKEKEGPQKPVKKSKAKK